MRTGRYLQRALLAVFAVLLVGAAWTSVAGRTPTVAAPPTPAAHSDHGNDRANAAMDVTDAVAAPMLGTLRTAELRLTPLWALPGLAAALAALCVLRRLRRSPTQPGRSRHLRGSVVTRAPPLAPIA